MEASDPRAFRPTTISFRKLTTGKVDFTIKIDCTSARLLQLVLAAKSLCLQVVQIGPPKSLPGLLTELWFSSH